MVCLHAGDGDSLAAQTPTLDQQTRRRTVALLAIALGVFTVTATEMVPIGLLPDIAADLRRSEGAIGLSVSLYGVIAGLLAPFLTAAFRRLDRRSLLLLILVTFTLGNILTAVSFSYAVLLVSRLLTGVVHGVMWSVVASIAVRLVRPERGVQATAIVFSGISLALVLGVPLGTFIGHLWGWRIAFATLAVLSALTVALLVALMPRLPPDGGVDLRELPRLLRIPNLRIAVVLTSVVVIGNYAAYTYVTPFLIGHAGIDAGWVSALLLCYGVAGLVGNFAGAHVVARGRPLGRVLAWSIMVLCGALILLFPLGTWVIGVAVSLAVWGAAYSALPVILQTLVLRSAPGQGEAATSVYVLAFNVSIALGALSGGIGIDNGGASMPVVVGVSFCVLALAATLTASPRLGGTPLLGMGDQGQLGPEQGHENG